MTLQDAWAWLKADIQRDVEEWQDRGIIASSLLAAADAWFWLGSGIRMLVHLWTASLYLPGRLTSVDDQIRGWNAHPIVIEACPSPVEANARTLTCLLGIAAVITLGPLAKLGMGSALSRVWVSSQVWFLVLDPVWGLGHYLAVGREAYTGPWRPLTEAEPDT